MDSQFPDDICVSRNQGNEQSRKAHENILPHKAEARLRVYEHIQSCGVRGATNWEIAQAFGVEQSSVSPRVTELLVAGLVIDSKLRRPTRSGSEARVVIAAEFGQRLISEISGGVLAGNATL